VDAVVLPLLFKERAVSVEEAVTRGAARGILVEPQWEEDAWQTISPSGRVLGVTPSCR